MENNLSKEFNYELAEAREKQMGIFYVCAELMKRGYSIAFPAGTPLCDIIVSRDEKNSGVAHVDVLVSSGQYVFPKERIAIANDQRDERYNIILVRTITDVNCDDWLTAVPQYAVLNRRVARNLIKDRNELVISWEEVQSKAAAERWSLELKDLFLAN